jgi:hypothetical protein
LDVTINLLPDLTSESIQPVVGRSASEANAYPGFVTGLDFPIGGAGGGRPREDLLTSQVLAPSSLAPAFSAPIDTRQMRPLPAILEVPKRKF